MHKKIGQILLCFLRSFVPFVAGSDPVGQAYRLEEIKSARICQDGW